MQQQDKAGALRVDSKISGGKLKPTGTEKNHSKAANEINKQKEGVKNSIEEGGSNTAGSLSKK